MDLEQVLSLRRTTRKYQPTQISEADLQKILDAAQTAPLAAGDDKTTHITVVQDPALLSQIREVTQVVSRKTGNLMDALYGAPTVIFLSATDLSEDSIEYANMGCVIENMILQATALQLGSTYIWGCLAKIRDHAELVQKMNIPDQYRILSAMAVGHPVAPLAPRDKKNKMTVNRI
ncbi:MAG TPA: nitroreductase family protein [Patescibacteria group bacterium]|nr:nitroreductase family protein [Patescibacteria group bacterium]